ncbi:MAG TPA: hypothetical protein VN037_08990 [Verrucomicrobiae bacterium]|nr:hypothetical protein [Verrucomicrobiae bacterium]
MTKDAKAAVGIAKALGDLPSRQMFDEESTESLVLAVQGAGRLEKDLGEIC